MRWEFEHDRADRADKRADLASRCGANDRADGKCRQCSRANRRAHTRRVEYLRRDQCIRRDRRASRDDRSDSRSNKDRPDYCRRHRARGIRCQWR